MTKLKQPDRWRQWLVWLLSGASIMMALAQPVVAFIGGLSRTFTDLFLPVSGLLFVAVGLLIIRSQPANRIGILSLLTGSAITLMNLLFIYSEASLALDTGLPGIELAWLLLSLLGPTMIFGPFVLLPLLFPNGRPLSPRWGWLGRTVFVLGLAIGTLQVLDPGEDFMTGSRGVLLTLPAERTDLIALIQSLALGLTYVWILGIFVGAGSLFLRWRRSRGLVRRQLTAFVSLTSLLVGFQIVMEILGGLILPGFFETAIYGMATRLVWLALPLILGVTVLRYRLYDVEVIINRSLVYGALSASLAAVYFGSVVVLQALFRAASGGESPLVIVLSTLMIAVLFAPLRQRIQAFIDRRFYRRKYDARRTLERFAATARDEVDLERLTAALVQTVDETMQPEQLALWLRSETADQARRTGRS